MLFNVCFVIATGVQGPIKIEKLMRIHNLRSVYLEDGKWRPYYGGMPCKLFMPGIRNTGMLWSPTKCISKSTCGHVVRFAIKIIENQYNIGNMHV